MEKNCNKIVIQIMAEQQVINVKKATPDPIGQVHEVSEILEYVNALTKEWDKIRGNIPAWQFWKKSYAGMHKATQFLLQSVDGLVMLVDDMIELGPDKKATVLHALNVLYEYVVREAVPIYLRPFAGRIKDYVIYTLASSAIDWMVGKYREGAWRSGSTPASDVSAE